MAKSAEPGVRDRKRRFSQKQYQMLLRCARKHNITEWNRWRKDHTSAPILLEGVDLSGCWLQGAYLNQGVLTDKRGRRYHFVGDVHLEGANLSHCSLRGATLARAHLQGATLIDADLRGADLCDTQMEGARLGGAIVRGATV